MSLFLGPIHHWLYRKIRLQEELITTLAEREGARSGDSGKYETYVNRELRPLEELIDTDNIHGWLQARIHDAEGRYAALVAAILKEDDLFVMSQCLANLFGQARRERTFHEFLTA